MLRENKVMFFWPWCSSGVQFGAVAQILLGAAVKRCTRSVGIDGL
jgi:hypothetical protein